MSQETSFQKSLVKKTWCYAVPPENTMHVVIFQREDGPFHGAEDGHRQIYTSVEKWTLNGWVHVEGSSRGGFHTWEDAFNQAVRVWENLQRYNV